MSEETGEPFVLGHKQTVVGSFYESLAHKIFGGELTRDENGDLCLWRSETSIEVKASGFNSAYGFRLSVEQIKKYERLNGFPFNRVWYVLFAYKNRPRRTDEGKHSSELAIHTEKPDVERFLAEQTLWCVLVDLSIVTGWRETRKSSTKSVLGHLGSETIDLQCKVLAPLFDVSPVMGLMALNFEPHSLSTLSGKIEVPLQLDLFNTFTVRFPVVAILPRSEASRVQKSLRRRGFRLKRDVLL